MGNLRLGLTAVGILASFVSTWFSVQLYLSFASVGADKIVYSLCGICMQGMQVLVYVASWYYLWREQRPRALVGFFCFFCLMCLSIVASIGFFSVVSKRSGTEATHSSDVYKALKASLAQTEQETQALHRQIEHYSSKGYITRGVKPAEARLDSLKADRQNLLKELENCRITPDSDALYEMLAEFFTGKKYTSEDVQRIKLYIYFASAVLLDLVGAVLLGFSLDFGKTGPRPLPEAPGASRSRIAPGGSAGASDPERAMIAGPGGHPADLQALLARIRDLESSVLAGKESPADDDPLTSTLTCRGKDHDPGNGSDAAPGDELNAGLLLRYVEHLYPAKPDGSLTGRTAIADRPDITYKEAERYHRFLKQTGFVRVRGNRTFPTMTKERLLSILGNGHGNEVRSEE